MSSLGIIVFDHINDIIYARWNQNFLQYLQSIAITQGLLPSSIVKLPSRSAEIKDQPSHHTNTFNQGCVNPNVIVQVFSPLVTSYRIMTTQFKNSYESVFCEGGTTIVFDEYSNFLFLCIGTYSDKFLRRFANVCIQMIKLTVGPCVSMIKTNAEKRKTLDSLLSVWLKLYANEQSYLVEAIERLIVNPDLSSLLISTLSALVSSVVKKKDVGSCHALFFIKNKLLNLYSSKEAEEIAEADLLSLNLLMKADSLKDVSFSSLNMEVADATHSTTCDKGNLPTENEDTEDEWLGDSDDDLSPSQKPDEQLSVDVKECILLLKTRYSKLSPHFVYTYQVTSELSLITVVEINRSQISGYLLEAFCLLENFKNEDFNPKDFPYISTIDSCLQKSQDAIKSFSKATYQRMKKCLNQVSSRWDTLKKTSLEDWLKAPSDSELPSRLEAGVSSLLEAIRTAWGEACLGVSPSILQQCLQFASLKVKEAIEKFVPSLNVATLKNPSQGSYSIISINKYLEEFPGLVHFLYIDRSVHQLTAPQIWTRKVRENASVQLSEAQCAVQRLTAARIWSMVEFARDHLSKGHVSLMWKDKTFSYSYFLWFEDQSGNPLKPAILDKEALIDLPLPGILCADFYKAFASKAFPDIPAGHLQMFELFCIHLGMTTSPCILEQTRRLAATVWEISGPPTANPLDLL